MIITKIEPQRHNNERYSVFIDGEFAFGMSGVDILYYKLNEGMELTVARRNFLYNEVLFTKARECAYSYLSYRARTKKEICGKLNDYPAIIVDRVLDSLEKYGYINDYEYAKNYIEARIRSKSYGQHRLRHELIAKGIDKSIIDDTLANIDFDEVDAAISKLHKKAKGEAISNSDKKRLFGYLSRQGFGCDVIEQAFKEYELGV